jgi:hypothetical protein
MMPHLSKAQEQLIKRCVDCDIKLSDLINNAKWAESITDVFATSASSKNTITKKSQLSKLHKFKENFEIPIFSDDLFDKLQQNEFMQSLYASTRKGVAHKDDQNTKDTSVEFSVNGGGDKSQPSTD